MQLSLEPFEQSNSHTTEAYSLNFHTWRHNTLESRSSYGTTRIPTSPAVCIRGLIPSVSNANGALLLRVKMNAEYPFWHRSNDQTPVQCEVA